MNNINISKKVIGIIAVLVLLAIIGFVSCSGGSNKKDKANGPSSSLFPDSTVGSAPKAAPTAAPTNGSTTLAPYTTTPFSLSAQKNLYALPKTGKVNSSNPGTYISPRYEAIIGSDTSSGIPISELDNPKNSDLDASTFKVVRDTAIAITKAQITGEGASNYPSYFGDGNEPGTCTKFNLKNAGATKLPLAKDKRWIVSIIFWSATCGSADSSFYRVDQQTSVYFTLSNGILTPRSYSEVPKS